MIPKEVPGLGRSPRDETLCPFGGERAEGFAAVDANAPPPGSSRPLAGKVEELNDNFTVGSAHDQRVLNAPSGGPVERCPLMTAREGRGLKGPVPTHRPFRCPRRRVGHQGKGRLLSNMELDAIEDRFVVDRSGMGGPTSE